VPHVRNLETEGSDANQVPCAVLHNLSTSHIPPTRQCELLSRQGWQFPHTAQLAGRNEVVREDFAHLRRDKIFRHLPQGQHPEPALNPKEAAMSITACGLGARWPKHGPTWNTGRGPLCGSNSQYRMQRSDELVALFDERERPAESASSDERSAALILQCMKPLF
jgi:hypothetical protein